MLKSVIVMLLLSVSLLFSSVGTDNNATFQICKEDDSSLVCGAKYSLLPVMVAGFITEAVYTAAGVVIIFPFYYAYAKIHNANNTKDTNSSLTENINDSEKRKLK